MVQVRQPISGATTAKYITPAITDADNGANFYVVVKNSVTSVTSNSAYLTVGDPPVIASQPTNNSVIIPAYVSYHVDAYGTGPFNYLWYKNGVLMPSFVGPDYLTGSVTLADNKSTYFVRIQNAYGTITSKPWTLTVNPSNTTGTYPIVGLWAGTITGSNPLLGFSGAANVSVAISQTPYSLLASWVGIDQKTGKGNYAIDVASLNGQTIYLVKSTAFCGNVNTFNVAGGFTTDLSTLNLTGSANQVENSCSGFDGKSVPPTAFGTGKLSLSTDNKTLTGTLTSNYGSATVKLTRQK